MSFRIRSRRFIARYFARPVEWVYGIKLWLIPFKQPPVIVLTPGKVGSSSVYSTIKKETKHPTFHIHLLSKKGIAKSTKSHISSDRKSRPLHLIVSKLLERKLKNYTRKIFVITIVREPISREVSAFFQNSEMYKNTLENSKLEIDTNKAKELLQIKLGTKMMEGLEQWFDQEINQNFEIDIFSEPFNEKEKHIIFKKEKVSLLLMRMEDLNIVFPSAIKEFLNLERELGLQNSNVADNKHYAESYNKIKSDLKFKKEKIDQILNSKYFKHFYKEKEQEIKNKWAER